MSEEQRPAVAEMSYEDARAELVQIVRTLESGQAPLEESMALWERGEEIARHCQSILAAAKGKIEQANASAE